MPYLTVITKQYVGGGVWEEVEGVPVYVKKDTWTDYLRIGNSRVERYYLTLSGRYTIKVVSENWQEKLLTTTISGETTKTMNIWPYIGEGEISSLSRDELSGSVLDINWNISNILGAWPNRTWFTLEMYCDGVLVSSGRRNIYGGDDAIIYNEVYISRFNLDNRPTDPRGFQFKLYNENSGEYDDEIWYISPNARLPELNFVDVDSDVLTDTSLDITWDIIGYGVETEHWPDNILECYSDGVLIATKTFTGYANDNTYPTISIDITEGIPRPSDPRGFQFKIWNAWTEQYDDETWYVSSNALPLEPGTLLLRASDSTTLLPIAANYEIDGTGISGVTSDEGILVEIELDMGSYTINATATRYSDYSSPPINIPDGGVVEFDMLMEKITFRIRTIWRNMGTYEYPFRVFAGLGIGGIDDFTFYPSGYGTTVVTALPGESTETVIDIPVDVIPPGVTTFNICAIVADSAGGSLPGTADILDMMVIEGEIL